MSNQPPNKKVFIFWDNSNIFISAKEVARQRESGDAYYHVRIQFENLLKLAAAGRQIEFAVAVGSIPPPLQHVWNRLDGLGVKVELFERGAQTSREQAVDQALQIHMLRKTIDYNGTPGVAVLLTGDGKGLIDGVGFHADLARMHKKGWGIEVLAWDSTCAQRMREWVRSVGVFVPLENHYDSVTYTETDEGVIRRSSTLDLTGRDLAR